MRRVGLQILESYKVEEKLLVSFRIMQIMWNAHKEFPIRTFKNISLNSSNWEGHELEETLATTMSSQEILKAETVNHMREWLLHGSSMGSRMGFWKRSKLGSTSIFNNHLIWWTVQDCKAYGFGVGSSSFRSWSFRLSFEGPTNWSLVFLNFLALWLLFPPLKLESFEVGLLRHASSNFSFNLHSNFG